MRINKYLSWAGVCSRRAADKLIKDKRIRINNQIATIGMNVDEDAEVELDGKRIIPNEERVIIKFNKPIGVICTSDKNAPDNIIEKIHTEARIYPVGRLDVESSGLILLTNNGELAHRLMHPSFEHEKEYLVTVDKEISPAFINKLAGGVKILNKLTSPATVNKESSKSFKIILKEGMNRQIRRMCEAVGYEVKKLKRIRIANIKLGALAIGQWSIVKDKELMELLKKLDLNDINMQSRT